MVDSRAASRYVKSLLGLAVEKGVLEDVHRDMLLFSDVVSKSRPFELLLQNPIIKHHKKLEILKKIPYSRVVNGFVLTSDQYNEVMEILESDASADETTTADPPAPAKRSKKSR